MSDYSPERSRAYYLKNRERILERQFRYREANRDSVRATNRASYEKHRKRRLEYLREYGERNRERMREKAKLYREANRQSINKRKKAWYWSNREKVRAGLLKRFYDLDLGEYERLRNAQKGLCALCGKPPTVRGLHVDHDHATGKIRGLLCSNCNTGLGLLGDGPNLLRAALRYLGCQS